MGVERIDDRAYIAGGDAGRVRVASVGDNLDIGCLARIETALEVLGDLNDKRSNAGPRLRWRSGYIRLLRGERAK